MAVPRRSPRARKRLGQHFLIDPRVANRTLDHARLGPADDVLEIGPGTGFLTRRLAARCRRVLAVEADRRLVATLARPGALPANVEVVLGDARKVDLGTLGRFNKVVANLPYSVSTPITFRLLPLRVDVHMLMFQKEFALRLAAMPGDENYGRLAAACAYWARAEYVETVPRRAFSPPPRVESALVRLEPHPQRPFPAAAPEAYERLLRVVFSTRRKTVRATLRHQHRLVGLPDLAAAERACDDWGLADRRPEELAPSDLGRLSLILEGSHAA